MLYDDVVAMDSVACHIIYVDRDICDAKSIIHGKEIANGAASTLGSDQLAQSIFRLQEAFGSVHLCTSGGQCLDKVFQLHDSSMIDLRPTIVLIDIPFDEVVTKPPSRSGSSSPHSVPSEPQIQTPDEEVYGLKLLQRLTSEVHLRSISKLVVLVPVISLESPEDYLDNHTQSFPTKLPIESRRLIRKCLDLGAGDAVLSPITLNAVTTLEMCAYRAHMEATKDNQSLLEIRRGRKRSWVGVDEGKPFAYLREAMVSGLMKHICRSEEAEDRIRNVKIAVSSERRAAIATAVGQWNFSAHSFSDDELLVAAIFMFRHALDMPELENWRVPTDQLINFLVACRTAYNHFVPYHNFRHVVDVLQATFHFLVRIGILSPYADSSEPEGLCNEEEKPPMVSILSPFEGLTLLITAIGHDVGHPGVNNGFLITLNAPLAQLYNDRSVLESFHCAAYSQILRRYWPKVFEDTKMRSLMISSILATDMGLHFEYMKKMENIQGKLGVDNTTDGWNGRFLEEQKALACSLLIKCADISNVARKYDTAIMWSQVLCDEFARQASMEFELEIPTSLLSEPKRDTMSLARSQLNFMNLFAFPLFQGVASIMPAMQYTVDQMEKNKNVFATQLREEKSGSPNQKKRLMPEGTLSPRTMSFEVGGGGDSGKATPIRSYQSPSPSPRGGHLDDRDLSPIRPGLDDNSSDHTPNASHATASASALATNEDAQSSSEVRSFRDPFGGDEDEQDFEHDYSDERNLSRRAQRCSETTDGSNSAPGTSEWASQATSATTGKMPLSPSTQNTSIVSRDSTDQSPEVPDILEIRPPSISDSEPSVALGVKSEGLPVPDGESNGNGNGKQPTLLKKKSSRFRMNALAFFKRNKGSPTPSTTDATG